MSWQSPSLTVKWGSYFQPDAADEKLIVDMVVAATPHTTKRMRMEKLAPVFSIENIDKALEELEGEQDEQAQRELDATISTIDAEASAQRSVQTAKQGASGARGDSGRPPGGKVPPSKGPRK